jgi:hypothetical protein
MSDSRTPGCCFAPLIFASVIGCTGTADNPHQVVPVSGVVLLDGESVREAIVEFVPTEFGRPAAFAKTDANGRFSLSTYGVGDGAVPGNYRVRITQTEVTGDLSQEEAAAYLQRHQRPPPSPVFRNRLPARYAAVETSGLAYEIGSDGVASIELLLTSDGG